MVESQNHGFTIQECFQHPEILPGWTSDRGRSKFDVPGKYTPDGNPWSIKAIRVGGAIDMGSAPRMWDIFENGPDIWLYLVTYQQNGPYKELLSLDKYLLDVEVRKKLQGFITLQEVLDLEKKLVNDFPVGTHAQARKWWKEQRNLLADRAGGCKLGAKVDSRDQRRWQCSIKREVLMDIFGPLRNSLEIDKGFCLPEKILSSPRRRG